MAYTSDGPRHVDLALTQSRDKAGQLSRLEVILVHYHKQTFGAYLSEVNIIIPPNIKYNVISYTNI